MNEIKTHMPFVYDDGGRKEAGRKGSTGDCVCRSITIALGSKPYTEIYGELAHANASERGAKRGRSASHGIHTARKWFKDYMRDLGFIWTPCMGIGTGCKVHLVAGELPMGRLIVMVSGHCTAVIEGVIRDIYDPQRRTYWYDRSGAVERISERCVYGYWALTA